MSKQEIMRTCEKKLIQEKSSRSLESKQEQRPSEKGELGREAPNWEHISKEMPVSRRPGKNWSGVRASGPTWPLLKAQRTQREGSPFVQQPEKCKGSWERREREGDLRRRCWVEFNGALMTKTVFRPSKKEHFWPIAKDYEERAKKWKKAKGILLFRNHWTSHHQPGEARRLFSSFCWWIHPTSVNTKVC